MQNLHAVDKLIESRLEQLGDAVANYVMNEIYEYINDFIFDDDLVVAIKEFILYNGIVEFENACIDLAEHFDNVPNCMDDFEEIVKNVIEFDEVTDEDDSDEEENDSDEEEEEDDNLTEEMTINLTKLTAISNDASITDEILVRALLHRIIKREINDRKESIMVTNLLTKVSDYLESGNAETLLRIMSENITDRLMNELLDDASDMTDTLFEKALSILNKEGK